MRGIKRNRNIAEARRIGKILNEYRGADRGRRDHLWMMYIGLRTDFDRIEDEARDKCAECGQNPHNAHCKAI